METRKKFYFFLMWRAVCLCCLYQKSECRFVREKVESLTYCPHTKTQIALYGTIKTVTIDAAR
jgi:hypothetical protein